MNTSDFKGIVSENKWILVTGASRGLGYETAKILLTHKHPVLVAARTLAKAEEAVEKLRQETHRDATVQPLELDVSDPASIAAAVAEIRDTRNHKIGVLVNNAAVTDDHTEWSQQTWDTIMGVNLQGPLDLTEQLLPLLADGGRVVMVSSSAGKTRGSWFPSEDYATEIEGLPSTLDAVRGVRWNPNDKGAKELADKGIAGPTPTRPVYCVSKALLNKGVQVLAEDERVTSRGLSVVAVCPGWCRTDMGSKFQSPKGPDPAWKGGSRIAWAVEHKDAAELNGRFWSGDGDTPETIKPVEYNWLQD
mmetsp:Transcript_5060/g.14545  ORF Transcript_5060/g.14545 Transcript_5060/m.14545 type:complete len:305 (-) Transcript_5060:512-1426(-)|eukprot:CAMPEP_0206142826 /NCGR_PEP_ID=MMETSP1473-20131121/18350_1 /ASSEMBLY_ACC=CAM_ASM_001109 /TAXON_ID=1461547 /ORGANISM="Stichococcus sp, Strain RCC1054" /LENGTH=304 /DNA_ID=CAMNT_0053537973 /DNA_START=91 /DNA_END=1005 /DNA_ORIENTATION=+